MIDNDNNEKVIFIDYTYMHPGIDENKAKEEYPDINISLLVIDKTIKENFKGIKNFLRYCIINNLGICAKPNVVFKDKEYFDYDKMSEVKEDLRKYIECKYKESNTIYYSMYQTDTANSVQTLLGFYMRGKYNKDYLNYYCPDKYKITKFYDIQKGYRDYHFLKMLIENENVFINDEVLIKLNELCELYHSRGNMIFVPKGFNSIRSRQLDGIDTNDFLDIGLNYLMKYSYKYNNNIYYNNDPKLFEIMTGYKENMKIGDDLFKNFSLSPNLSKNIKNPYDDLKKNVSEHNIDNAIINTAQNMIKFINERNEDFNNIIGDIKV